MPEVSGTSAHNAGRKRGALAVAFSAVHGVLYCENDLSCKKEVVTFRSMASDFCKLKFLAKKEREKEADKISTEI